ncbi:MAG: RNA polymerase sigma factor [Lachnospiraceae bacterium]|nr:RNA polymerase sigma factor [Lachnospiraceae bacterium]
MSMEIEEYYDKIYRYCYYKVGNKTLAEDLTQETFLKYLKSTCTRPEHYLYTIARNLCIDEYRKVKTVSLEEETVEPADGGFEQSVVDREAVAKALGKLSEEDRELMILRFVNDEPLSEICKITGLSRFALYRRLNNAKSELVKYLEE